MSLIAEVTVAGTIDSIFAKNQTGIEGKLHDRNILAAAFKLGAWNGNMDINDARQGA